MGPVRASERLQESELLVLGNSMMYKKEAVNDLTRRLQRDAQGRQRPPVQRASLEQIALMGIAVETSA